MSAQGKFAGHVLSLYLVQSISLLLQGRYHFCVRGICIYTHTSHGHLHSKDQWVMGEICFGRQLWYNIYDLVLTYNWKFTCVRRAVTNAWAISLL